MAKAKFYVVWSGKVPGVYTDWGSCEAQIKGFPDAKYKSFSTLNEAEKAFKENYKKHIYARAQESNTSKSNSTVGQPILDSISVDGSWITTTGFIEYQGVKTGTKELLFRVGPYPDGTNNIAEFLAIVHALAYCKQHHLQVPIYSDSVTAMSWVKRKAMKTNVERTENNVKLFEIMERAQQWLANNTYSNPILKWETEFWGENPADFGRK